MLFFTFSSVVSILSYMCGLQDFVLATWEMFLLLIKLSSS